MSLEVQIKGNKIFAPLKGKDLVLTPEELVRQRYICRLVNHYKYSLDQMEQEKKLTESKRGTGRASADIVIWRSKEEKQKKLNPIIVIECKADYITIQSEDYYQGQNYARFANAPFFVTTNEKETKVFKVNLEVTPKTLSNEILDIPTAKEAISSDKIKKLLSQTKAFERDEFSKLLFQCHNVIRNNDKLSPEAAFDEISKILFMKIRYERNPDEDNIFTLKQFERQETNYEKNIRPVNIKRNGPKDDIPYMDYWFELTKDEFEEDDLFDANEKIKIKQGSFKEIVKKLQKYNLSTTSDDVKGIAFEQFLGGTFRGELGQFFTPRTVVDFIIDVLDPQEDEIICDPCCGSGGFLIKAFEYVRDKIENDIRDEKDKVNKAFDESDSSDEKLKEISNEILHQLGKETQIRKREEQETAIKNDKFISRLEKLSSSCIFGTDANPRMARTAKMNMIMHGDGHGGVHHRDGLLNVNGIFENRFDVILTNPPFGSRVEKSLLITNADRITDEERIKKYKSIYGEKVYKSAMSQIDNNIDKPVLDTLHIGKEGMSGLTEVLFIERCINLLKPGGRIGIVLPEGVLNTQNLAKVREYFESTAKLILITSIPQDVFMKSGATVKSSLVFMKKFTEEETKLWDTYTDDANKLQYKKFEEELTELTEQLAKRGADAPTAKEKKVMRQRKSDIEETIKKEVRRIVKEKFDYEIPIATVEKAGISSTGAVIENELVTIEKEYTPYRIENNLWNESKPDFKYIWSTSTSVVERVKNGQNSQKLED
ncbi:N-6 DNA methylase [Flammeovirga kamogawensis]|uniref:N-6 DNA methylase n=1 Tax=Flammeovirga kamogawensis TaxID=373891 RepID=A0ABX8H3E8_9BACT|nr:N-6 DNA methylase [Flammeovirga kamogawensis]MBB6461970.1 type I restriction enzyme M protein [Flammeovirga kamogawensis]QWG10426.1 N-6 DNA methylase [Flammeovirga kamogawensis]TRX63936.1 N-6 DNA methylase [Flammeovirga kamogawensis]